MARRSRNYDEIHNYVERVEDILLSESSWSTSDSECSGCLHLSKTSLQESEQDLQIPPPPPVKDKKKSSKNSSSISVFSNALKKCKEFKKKNKKEKSNSGTIEAYSYDNTIDRSLEKHMLQQLALMTAGAQPWNYNICTTFQNKFAYAATLVIYVYQKETGENWQLYCVLAEHRKTITCISWHPSNDDLLASSSADHSIIVWSVSRQCAIQAVNICKIPYLVFWCPGKSNQLSFSTEYGPIQVWNMDSSLEPAPYKNDCSFHPKIQIYAWHPTLQDKLVVGHDDGRITVFPNGNGRMRYAATPEGVDFDEHYPMNLITIAWDLHSSDYILVAYREGKLWLLDVSTFKIVTSFHVAAASQIATLAWLPNAPGMFLTGDFERGILRIWTVSKDSPLDNVLLKNTGFHILSVLPTPSDDTNCDNRVPIPSVYVLCLFIDGGIGVYHLRRKQWLFKREHGHTETIFDCSFKPEDSDLLATSSFDGSIKIWSVDTMQTVETLPNSSVIIYSVSWAPADLNCIVAGTSKGEVFIWDINKHKIIQDFKLHQGKKVFCVVWNRKDSRRIASVGENGSCFVTGINGSLLHEYKHPCAVYGCDWRDANILATGCGDGCIRIFDVSKSSKDAVTEIKGHDQKIFRVKWNPIYEDVLCSGSDDATVKIWSFKRGNCLAVLMGHCDNVRGLVWCPEVPYFLISGSWDQTIRVWDAKSSTCLDVVYDHRADVYGLSIHPLRPFLLASCSRDSTVRLWSLSKLVSPLQTMVLAGRPIDEIIGETDLMEDNNNGLRLCGVRSEYIMSTLSKTEADQNLRRKFKLTADLFSADVHVRNLWDLIHVLLGNTDISSLSMQYSSSIVHHSHLLKCALAKASEKEVHLCGKSVKGHTEENFSSLATLYLSCGALQQYCELMLKCGRWQNALSIAPAVSFEYWKDLIKKYSHKLIDEDNEECIPYLLVNKDSDKLVNFYISRGNLDSAFTSCIALGKSGSHSKKNVVDAPYVPPRGKGELMDSTVNESAVHCARNIAELHLNRGSPVQAACSLLAVDQIEECLEHLLRGNELELVIVAGHLMNEAKCFNKNKAELFISVATHYLTFRIFNAGLYKLALDLVETVPNTQYRLLLEVKLNIMCGDSELNSCFEKFQEALNSEYSTLNDIMDSFKISLSQGFYKGYIFLKDKLDGLDINYKEVWMLLDILNFVVLSNKIVMPDERKFSYLALSSFFAALKAHQLRYYSVVQPLFSHCRYIIEKHNISEMDITKNLLENVGENVSQSLTNERTICGFELSQVGSMWIDVGEVKTVGSHLPRHNDGKICNIRQEIIKGPAYILEDGLSAVSLNDAIMWARVFPFSPLGTGSIFFPY